MVKKLLRGGLAAVVLALCLSGWASLRWEPDAVSVGKTSEAGLETRHPRHLVLLPLGRWGFGKSTGHVTINYDSPSGVHYTEEGDVQQTRYGFFETNSFKSDFILETYVSAN